MIRSQEDKYLKKAAELLENSQVGLEAMLAHNKFRPNGNKLYVKKGPNLEYRVVLDRRNLNDTKFFILFGDSPAFRTLGLNHQILAAPAVFGLKDVQSAISTTDEIEEAIKDILVDLKGFSGPIEERFEDLLYEWFYDNGYRSVDI